MENEEELKNLSDLKFNMLDKLSEGYINPKNINKLMKKFKNLPSRYDLNLNNFDLKNKINKDEFSK